MHVSRNLSAFCLLMLCLGKEKLAKGPYYPPEQSWYEIPGALQREQNEWHRGHLNKLHASEQYDSQWGYDPATYEGQWHFMSAWNAEWNKRWRQTH